MASNDYRFVTRWRVNSDIQTVYDLIARATDYPRWWPDVYMTVTQDTPPDAHGVGAAGDLYTRGWLPYTLRWRYVVTKHDPPRGFAIAATGDFEGTGTWTFLQQGDTIDITFVWTIRAHKPLLKFLSFLLKPVFTANHQWAMRRGEESLQRELVRLGVSR